MNGNRELSQEWFKKAGHDLLNVEIILESERTPLPLDTVCFHCQQAVEKYLKGFLVYHNVQFARTHFLGTLLDQCKELDESFEELHAIIDLNAYAVDIRYPDETMEFSLEDARKLTILPEGSKTLSRNGFQYNRDVSRRRLHYAVGLTALLVLPPAMRVDSSGADLGRKQPDHAGQYPARAGA
jgi:HEPN domain-containing protein